jgi:hypothetical protein
MAVNAPNNEGSGNSKKASTELTTSVNVPQLALHNHATHNAMCDIFRFVYTTRFYVHL